MFELIYSAELYNGSATFLLQRAQNQAGMSRRKLPEVTGISPATLSRIISGTREPTSAELLLNGLQGFGIDLPLNDF